MRLRIFFLTITNIFLFTVATQAAVTLGPLPNEDGDLGLVIVASKTPEYIKEGAVLDNENYLGQPYEKK